MKYASTDLYLVVLEVHSTVGMLAADSPDRWLQVRRFALLVRSFAPPPVLESAFPLVPMAFPAFRTAFPVFFPSPGLAYSRSLVLQFSGPCVLPFSVSLERKFSGTQILRNSDTSERRSSGTQILRNSDTPELRVTGTQSHPNADPPELRKNQ